VEANDDDEPMVPSKDVWGNEDPRRKEREVARIISSDPLAAMRQGAAKVRQVEKERKQWKAERDREMLELLHAEGRRKKRKRRHEDEAEDDLDSFNLDATENKSYPARDERRSSKHGESHRRSHRDKSRDRDRHRRHHRH